MLKEMSIEVVRKCPNNCIHCSSSSSIECNEIISFDMFKKVVDGAKKLGLKTLCFSGGEPFLHPDILEMVHYVAGKGIQSYIYTSGIYINEKNKKTSIPESLLIKLEKIVTKLIFNVEAVSEDKYDKIMGTHGCFQYLKKSITNSVNLGIICEAHFVPMKLNVGQVEQVVEFCKNIGVSKVSFLRLVPHGRALINKERILLNDEETELLKNKLLKLQTKYSDSIRIGVPLSDSTSQIQCEAAQGKLNIKYDGFVYPCEVFKNIEYSILKDGLPESIFDNDIEKIYNECKYLNNIRYYISNFCKSSNCENCAGQFYIKMLKTGDDDKSGE